MICTSFRFISVYPPANAIANACLQIPRWENYLFINPKAKCDQNCRHNIQYNSCLRIYFWCIFNAKTERSVWIISFIWLSVLVGIFTAVGMPCIYDDHCIQHAYCKGQTTCMCKTDYIESDDVWFGYKWYCDGR